MSLIDEKYEVLEQINEGGMGTIYKVRHRLLDEIRVVKVMRPQASTSESLRSRFLSEARMAIRVRHANIGQLYDFSLDETGNAVIVMEFIDGVTLQDILSSGAPPTVPFVIEIALQTLQALSCLHRNEIVHRDVASDNVMVTRGFDGRPLVKVIDLGIAKDPAAEGSVTATGVFVGKARYAAPEQFQGDHAHALTPAADLYSFGVLLYEMLTGQLPVGGTSFASLAAGHLFEPPVPFSKVDPDGRVPTGLKEAVLLALEKDPGTRISSAEELADRIRPFGSSDGPDPEELDALIARVRSGAPLSRQPGKSEAIEGIVEALLTPFAGSRELEILMALREWRQPPPAEPNSPREVTPAVPHPVLQPMGTPAARPSVEDKQRSQACWEPSPRPRRRPRKRPEPRSKRFPVVPIVAIALLAGLGSLAVWRLWPAPRPELTGDTGTETQGLADNTISQVLALPTNTTTEVDNKLTRVAAVIALLPAGDDRTQSLEREKSRLGDLVELHKTRDRLAGLARTAAGPDGNRKRDAENAAMLWSLFEDYRELFAADDPDVVQVTNSAREYLAEMAETTESEQLADLAAEP